MRRRLPPPPEPGRDQDLIDRNILKLAPGGSRSILFGRQSSTTRLGLRNYHLGSGLLVDGREQIPIFIWLLEATYFGALRIEHAVVEGFPQLSAFRQKIRKFYPNIGDDDQVTHIRFFVIDESERRRRWPVG